MGNTTERRDLKVAVDELDEEAWNVQDGVSAGSYETQEYLDAFARARGAHSIWFALSADPLEAALESAYEAQAARGRLDAFRAIVAAQLE